MSDRPPTQPEADVCVVGSGPAGAFLAYSLAERGHDVENRYVSGASAFVTYGAANPTLTIVALALRLADHLDTRL